MNLVVTIDQEAQEDALAAARKITLRTVSRDQGLPAPVSDNIMRWVDRVWDQIEQALRDALRQGRDAARSAIVATEATIAEAAKELGERVDEMEALIRRRLDEYLQLQIGNALARVQADIRIGNRPLSATGATIQQTVKFSGSLKTKLDDICSFLAESQIAVTVTYSQIEA